MDQTGSNPVAPPERSAQWANQYVGIPFVARGTTRRGVDCLGLLRMVYAEQIGIELPDHLESYGGVEPENFPEIAEAIKAERPLWSPISRWHEQEFDVAVFRMFGLPIHLAVVVRPGLMLHAMHGMNSVQTEYGSRYWMPKLYGFFRHADR